MKIQLILIFLIVSLLSSAVHSKIIYVNANQSTGSQDGSSWNNAFLDLKEAIASATYGDSIWVAQGTYKPTTSNIRHFSFNLKNGVRMFGGFTGTESQISQRDWITNETILSGDIGIQGDSTDNSYTFRGIFLSRECK